MAGEMVGKHPAKVDGQTREWQNLIQQIIADYESALDATNAELALGNTDYPRRIELDNRKRLITDRLRRLRGFVRSRPT